jgi:chromosome segregation protein
LPLHFSAGTIYWVRQYRNIQYIDVSSIFRRAVRRPMKLRKLDLFGFKSFYDKTTFEFSDGITAIVGPNGCGKSNIVDAIRWVLGEHAPSYLRSKALEDVIFAGSDAAGPLGMAEVTLTFGNEDGGAPPGYEAYAEIQITRRAFRDGDSEFSINRIPCRLKDIQELFLDTGAGARGYAIIEQGRIATIINARSDEKRLLVEEAAGVAKFRIRRKEAERKMESTRQNLARVRDIHDEVKRQLGSLERQVRKAERFKALKEELRNLDLMVAARRHCDLYSEAVRLGTERSEAGSRILMLRAELAGLEADRESGMLSLAEAEAALRTLREEQATLKERVARLSAEHDGKIREAEQLRAMFAETAEEIAVHEEAIADLTHRVGEAEEAARHRKSDLSLWKDRAAALAEAVGEARAEHVKAQDQAGQARSDFMVRVSLHSNAMIGAESLRKMLEENGRTLARLEDRLAESRLAAEGVATEAADAATSLEAAQAALTEADKAWEDTGAGLSAVVTRLEAAAESRRGVEGGLAASSSRVAALSRMYERRDWASAGVKAVLRRYKCRMGDGGGASVPFGVMGEMIETEEGFERAVEAVLGERVQSIVVRDQEEGLTALQYLKETREGRVSFIPMTMRCRDGAPGYAAEDGVIAPLGDVVRVPEGCEELVRGLFGGTLLVRDLESALRLWGRNGIWGSYVTLDGDMVTADGILIGGALEAGEGSILAGRREIRELEKEIAGQTAEAKRLAAEEAGLRRERGELEGLLQEAFRRREARARDQARAKERHAVAEGALSQARDRVASLEQERNHLSGEGSRMEAELVGLERAARESEEARGVEEERVKTLAAAIEETRARLEEVRSHLHAAEVEVAGQEEKERSERTFLAGLGEALSGKAAAAGERRRRLAFQEARIGALSGEIEAGRTAIEEAAASLALRQEEIDRKLGESAACTSAAGAVEAAIREVRQRESDVQERLSELRLAEQRIALEVSTLDDRTYRAYEVHPAALPVPEEGDADDLTLWEARVEEIRAKMGAIGEVNLASIEEHRELSERYAFLAAQKEDLEKSLDDLGRAIQRINRTTRERFREAFERINERLAEVFPKLLQGGRAYLTLIDEGNLLETGVEIVAQLPGKKLLPLKSLSGGERSLTAASLIFSIFLVRPSPFCLLDEADAALDDPNIDRFNALIRELSANYQILLITHNKRTMELADVLYGITMEKPGISKVVSVNFRD